MILKFGFFWRLLLGVYFVVSVNSLIEYDCYDGFEGIGDTHIAQYTKDFGEFQTEEFTWCQLLCDLHTECSFFVYNAGKCSLEDNYVSEITAELFVKTCRKKRKRTQQLLSIREALNKKLF